MAAEPKIFSQRQGFPGKVTLQMVMEWPPSPPTMSPLDWLGDKGGTLQAQEHFPGRQLSSVSFLPVISPFPNLQARISCSLCREKKKKKEPPQALQQEASSEDLFLTPSLTTPGSGPGPASSQQHTTDKGHPAGCSNTGRFTSVLLSELPCRLPPSLPWDTLL